MDMFKLIPTHNVLRNPHLIFPWIDMYKNGCSIKVALNRFEDGLVYVHDGHHRLCAMLLGGHKELQPSEYKMTEMTYIEYCTSNPRLGWYTPFDPRTQCRMPDFSLHKEQSEKKWKAGMNSVDFDEWVRTMEHRYVEKRFVLTMRDLLSCTLSTISKSMTLTNYKKYIL